MNQHTKRHKEMMDRAMTEKNSPLLPCPFCGELPENDKDAYVYCANAECPVCVEAYGTEAVASWNTRAVNGLPKAIAALEAMLDEYDRNVCEHEITTRGGHIWTICEGCGRKWADDEGGFVPHSDPPHVVEARAALTKLKG